MILSDRVIKQRLANGEIVVKPFDFKDIQPSSIDLHLDSRFVIFQEGPELIDARKKKQHGIMFDLNDLTTYPKHYRGGTLDYFDIEPNQFVLGSTCEWLEIPNGLVARLEGKSSLARLGLIIHTTAGYIDPGFRGQITLELKNVNHKTIRIYPGDKIAQLSFEELITPADKPYGHPDLNSKYQEQTGPVESRFYLNHVKH